MNIKLLRAYCLMSSILLGVAFCSGAEEPALSVCDVLARTRELNHQLVAVRGVQLASEEGTWLTGVNCSKPLITDGYQWPSTVWLELRTSIRRAAGFNLERYRLHSKLILAMISKQRHDTERDRVWLTYVGRLEAYDNLSEHVVHDSTGARGFGFGHMNAAPVMLIVSDVKDLYVEPASASKP